ncbi:40S ribosomal protein S8-2 [Abeliophyllum distichum]|uniref:40S ribosomal protein S8 n=1 Tax=Abeliophyllum distichum TaxID=126358 RepID=A0ABD1NQR8_9LAMI
MTFCGIILLWEIAGLVGKGPKCMELYINKQNSWPLSQWLRYELGRQPANTKLSSNKTVRRVRVRGGNVKWRALRLHTGNYSWGSEAVTRKTRLLDVVYNASNNELVRTQTLVKGAIVQVDAAPFKQ